MIVNADYLMISAPPYDYQSVNEDRNGRSNCFNQIVRLVGPLVRRPGGPRIKVMVPVIVLDQLSDQLRLLD